MATKAKSGMAALAATGIVIGAIAMVPGSANAEQPYMHGRMQHVERHDRDYGRGGFWNRGIGMKGALSPVVYVAPYTPPVYVPIPQPVYIPQQQYTPVPVPYYPQQQYIPAPVYCAPQPYVNVNVGPCGVGVNFGTDSPLGWINVGLRLRR